MGRGFRSGNPAWSPDGNWIAYSVVEVDAWPNPANGFNLIFGDSTIYVIDTKGNDVGKPLEATSRSFKRSCASLDIRKFFSSFPR